MSQTKQNDNSGAPTRDVILGHGADCDGIEEYDNALPSWWLGIFYFTVIWGIGYAVHYHFVGGRSQAAEYDAEMAEANVRWPPPKVTGVDLSPAAIAEGQSVYMSTCVACHGVDLHGGIGANLVDATWIHGGSPDEILKTVSEGVGTKGMPAWGKVLGPQKTASVAAFVYDAAQKAAAAAPPVEPAAPVTDPPPEGSTVQEGG